VIAIFPGKVEVQKRLRAFLLDILPAGTEVVEAFDNQTPEPQSANWVLMTPLRAPRLTTNVDTWMDCRFTGQIDGTKLTVAAVQNGNIAVGATIFGTGVAANTKIERDAGGGLFVISPSQTVAPDTVMATGQIGIQMESEWVYQLDFHSAPGGTVDAGDLAATFSALFRDPYAVRRICRSIKASSCRSSSWMRSRST
jgi:hypothetical protein